jgi:co-chaperonin GroES (HSP10)
MIEEGFILATKVLVKPEEIKESKSSGGILLPGNRKASHISGTVIKTGTGTDAVKMEASVGDQIFFYERSAQPLILDGEDYLLLDCREILFRLPAG